MRFKIQEILRFFQSLFPERKYGAADAPVKTLDPEYTDIHVNERNFINSSEFLRDWYFGNPEFSIDFCFKDSTCNLTLLSS